MSNLSRFGNSQKNFKPLNQVISQQQRTGLDNVIGKLDSDEEGIVNMGDDIDESQKETSKPAEEAAQQFAFVRRSKRLSTLSRNKSDISVKPGDFISDIPGRNNKFTSQERREPSTYLNYGMDINNQPNY